MNLINTYQMTQQFPVLPCAFTQENGILCSHLYTGVHGSLIHNGPKLEKVPNVHQQVNG